MNDWSIKNPWVFFGLGAALVGYLLYTMVRRRRGDRIGGRNREPELSVTESRRGSGRLLNTEN